MTIAYSCVLMALIFPYFFAFLAKTGPGYQNDAPREYLDKLTGWRKRAHWVQLNSFEIFPGFAVAVIIGHQLHLTQTVLNSIAITFVISRIFYSICYVTDKAKLRSLFWMIGFVCIITIFVVGFK